MSANELAKLQVRLPKDLHERLQAIAEREERSINGQIIYFLRQMIEADEEAQARAGKLAA